MTSSLPRARPFPWPALVCALAGAAVFQFFGNATRGYIDTASLFYWWGFQWTNPGSETEHGWLILGLSGWLLWRNLKVQPAESWELSAESRTSADRTLSAQLSALSSPWPAVVAMAFGLALHTLGFAAQQARLSIVALLVFAWGVLRLAGGRRWGAAAMFPLGFLVFAIPLNAVDSVGFWLRVWVIKASAGFAHASGIGVLQSGTQLFAPDGRYNYDVAAACSGVRSLTAIAALSLLAGYLNFHSWWRRTAVLLWCFPLVYLGNVARISAIVFAAQWGGQRWGDRAHDVMGYGVFAIVLGGVLGGIAVLQRWWPEAPDGGQGTGDRGRKTEDGGRNAAGKGSDATGDVNQTAEGGPSRNDGRGRQSLIDEEIVAGATGGGRGNQPRQLMNDSRVWGGALVVVVLAGAAMGFLHKLATMPPRGEVGVKLAADGRSPVELPAFLGRYWVGLESPVTAVEREILPADTGFARMEYVATRDSRHVLLSIVLSGRDRTSIHRPELCLVGQGWTITGATEHRFNFPGQADAAFPATVLRVQREMPSARGRVVMPQLVAYWFVGGDRVEATHWQRLARDAWNRVMHARADRWAYVLMQTNSDDGETAALARMQAVLNETLPGFQRPLPAR